MNTLNKYSPSFKNNGEKLYGFDEKFREIKLPIISKIGNVMDLGLTHFRKIYPDIWNEIGGNENEIEKHSFLAKELVKKLSLMEIIKIIGDKNIDSNIRLEVINTLSLKEKISEDLLGSANSNNLFYNKESDGVITLYSKVYDKIIVLFKNGKIIKGTLISTIEDKKNKGENIYSFLGIGKYNSNGEKI